MITKKDKLPGSMVASIIELIAAINIGLLIVHACFWLYGTKIISLSLAEAALSFGASLSCFALAAMIRTLHLILKELKESNLRAAINEKRDRQKVAGND